MKNPKRLRGWGYTNTELEGKMKQRSEGLKKNEWVTDTNWLQPTRVERDLPCTTKDLDDMLLNLGVVCFPTWEWYISSRPLADTANAPLSPLKFIRRRSR